MDLSFPGAGDGLVSRPIFNFFSGPIVVEVDGLRVVAPLELSFSFLNGIHTNTSGSGLFFDIEAAAISVSVVGGPACAAGDRCTLQRAKLPQCVESSAWSLSLTADPVNATATILCDCND